MHHIVHPYKKRAINPQPSSNHTASSLSLKHIYKHMVPFFICVLWGWNRDGHIRVLSPSRSLANLQCVSVVHSSGWWSFEWSPPGKDFQSPHLKIKEISLLQYQFHIQNKYIEYGNAQAYTWEISFCPSVHKDVPFLQFLPA